MGVDCVVVGAGLAGLACARRLKEAGRDVLVLEASDAVGGRVRSDAVAGFCLDRGFQIFLTSYPEARRVLDLDALDLRPFLPGALVRTGGRFARILDPHRHPLRALAGVLAPVGTLADKWRVGRVRREVRDGDLAALWRRPETTTAERLRAAGFGDAMVDTFFRPWFGGVFLDPSLQTSSRMFEFVFRMLSEGRATLPAAGMGSIPAQLAAGLGDGAVRLGRASSGARRCRPARGRRTRLGPRGRRRRRGSRGGTAPAGLSVPAWRGVTTLWFAADEPPIDEPILVLDGEGAGPVNDFHVASNVAPERAPPGAALCGATVLDDRGSTTRRSSRPSARSSGSWFGPRVDGWRLLRLQRIPRALPDQRPPALAEPRRAVRLGPGRYVCGDHRENASIDGALRLRPTRGRGAARGVSQAGFFLPFLPMSLTARITISVPRMAATRSWSVISILLIPKSSLISLMNRKPPISPPARPMPRFLNQP